MRTMAACTKALRKTCESGSVRSTSLRISFRVSSAAVSCCSSSFASLFMATYSRYSPRFFAATAFSLAELKGV